MAGNVTEARVLFRNFDGYSFSGTNNIFTQDLSPPYFGQSRSRLIDLISASDKENQGLEKRPPQLMSNGERDCKELRKLSSNYKPFLNV